MLNKLNLGCYLKSTLRRKRLKGMQEVLMNGFGKQESGLYKAICTSDFSMSEFDFVLNCHNVPEPHFADE